LKQFIGNWTLVDFTFCNSTFMHTPHANVITSSYSDLDLEVCTSRSEEVGWCLDTDAIIKRWSH